jgi:hypothetical protein
MKKPECLVLCEGMNGIGFKRTQTLAFGNSRCDFRFMKDYETSRGWPPEGLEEEFIL